MQILKKILGFLLKYVLPVGLVVHLFYQASKDSTFQILADQPKHWGLLVLAFLLALTATTLTFIRWWVLARALGLPMRIRDALRLGFLGHMLNYIAFGMVGGDLLKALYLAREHPERRAPAVASVFVDRVVGLYALFFLASIAMLVVNFDTLNLRPGAQIEAVRWIGKVSVAVTIVSTLTGIIFLLPGISSGPIARLLSAIPKVGPMVVRMFAAVRLYRHHLPSLILSVLMSLATHFMFIYTFSLIANGLPGEPASLGMLFVILPVALISASLPIPGGALGAFEVVFDFLYRAVSAPSVPERQGFIIALTYRLITVVITLTGVVYYLSARREVKQLMQEIEEKHEGEKAAEELEAAGNG